MALTFLTYTNKHRDKQINEYNGIILTDRRNLLKVSENYDNYIFGQKSDLLVDQFKFIEK